MKGPIAGDGVRGLSVAQPKRARHATDMQNAAAVAAGAAALGAVIGLAVSSTTIVPIAGAIFAGAVGAAGGRQANNVVRWWQRGSEDVATHGP